MKYAALPMAKSWHQKIAGAKMQCHSAEGGRNKRKFGHAPADCDDSKRLGKTQTQLNATFATKVL